MALVKKSSIRSPFPKSAQASAKPQAQQPAPHQQPDKSSRKKVGRAGRGGTAAERIGAASLERQGALPMPT